MKTYQVIYADPPWSYKNKKPRGNALKQYDTLSLEEISSLQIPSAENSVLFLWITVPLLPFGFSVMEAWGFKYKTMLTWVKLRQLGVGYYYRGQTEHLLFGTKGNIKSFRTRHRNVIATMPGKHSEKPEDFRKLIEQSTYHLHNKLELFARKESAGWDVFGNEVKNSIML